MKTLLFIPFLFVYSMVIGQTYNSASIIGKPIKIGKLEIAQKDFPYIIRMTWDEAKIACESLGQGWRLPTIDELKIMYKNNDKIGGFAKVGYWSSTEDDYADAWYFGFDDGNADYSDKLNAFSVRAVRAF